MKPIILISPSEDKSEDTGLERYVLYKKYAQAVTAVGGIPVVDAGAEAKEYSEIADGLLLSGGYDIDPSYSNQTVPSGCEVRIQPERDKRELELFSAFFSKNKPIFGICRGMQLINVAMGGDLIIDIPLQMGQNHMGVEHEVEFKEGTKLYNLAGEKITANSFHHQAVGKLGSKLTACGQSADGIIEAIEHKELPIFGVQFHPERMNNGNIFFSHLVHLCIMV